MIIDSHIHVFDRRVAGAEENFPLWPGNQWGGDEGELELPLRRHDAQDVLVFEATKVPGVGRAQQAADQVGSV